MLTARGFHPIAEFRKRSKLVAALIAHERSTSSLGAEAKGLRSVFRSETWRNWYPPPGARFLTNRTTKKQVDSPGYKCW